jgi:hypothetical protein
MAATPEKVEKKEPGAVEHINVKVVGSVKIESCL